jgi:cytochrome c1
VHGYAGYDETQQRARAASGVQTAAAQNAREHLRWLQVPQEIEPGSVMPNLDVTEQAARDMSAYLYTLRGD